MARGRGAATHRGVKDPAEENHKGPLLPVAASQLCRPRPGGVTLQRTVGPFIPVDRTWDSRVSAVPSLHFCDQGHFVFLPLQGDQADTPISKNWVPSFLSSPPLACNTPASSHLDLISFQEGLEAPTEKSGALSANGACWGWRAGSEAAAQASGGNCSGPGVGT